MSVDAMYKEQNSHSIDNSCDSVENISVVNKVISSISSARTVEEIISNSLDSVTEGFGWNYASYWAVDSKDNVLKFLKDSGSVNEEFESATKTTIFHKGEGLNGRVWETKDFVFIEDISKLSGFLRGPSAARAGIKSAISFPVLIYGKVIGTMDFFTSEIRHLSEERLETLRNVSNLVSMSLDAIRADVIQNMVDSIPVNVILADTDHKIVYINPASEKQLKKMERVLPVKVNEIVGSSIDIFHKFPQKQHDIINDPSSLPHRARIEIGEDTINLLVTAIYDKDENYKGPMVIWSVITGQVEFERDIKNAVTIVAEAATEMHATSKTMASNTEETARQSKVVATASNEVTRNIKTVSSATEKLSTSIAGIAQHVQDASKMSSAAVEQADSTNLTINELGQSSDKIGQVVEVITSIAQQTNLLALNATIEAARAGESGKGFAVVANEVKELARQTAKATEEISKKINSIQSATSVAVTAVGLISDRINAVSNINNTIASSIEEQLNATNEISQNAFEAAESTVEVASNIASVSQAAKEGGCGAAELIKVSEGLAQESNKLDTITNEFLEGIKNM